jgi:hypothetical protein
MAYDPAKRAARERAFRAEHGVSSGTYYRMRRQAAAGGIRPKAFDKLARQEGYDVAKQVTRDQRQAYQQYKAGVPRSEIEWDMTEYEDLDIDREWFWIKSPTAA